MLKLTIYPGNLESGRNFNLDKRDSSNVAFKASDNDNFVSKQNYQLSDKKIQNNQPKQELNDKKWTGRKVVDALTVTTYAAIVMAAIAIKKCRPSVVKDVEKLAANKTAGRTIKDEIALKGKILKGECDKGGPLYRVFDYFGKLKENSAELTNNLVYGFGTLVIMPLVILFSPIGKKDASKEDRTFTVLRQPISFATVFAAQLTFDKIFKTLIPELNKFGLLDGIKHKGKELYFNDDRMYEVVKDSLNGSKNKNAFSFDKIALSKFKSTLPTSVIEHIDGSSKEFIDGDSRIPVEIKAKGNKFTLDEFTDGIVSIIKDMGEKPIEEKKISGTNTKIVIDKIDNLKQLLSHYVHEIPDFAGKLETMAYSGTRCRALKETSVIIANSIISQALGIMTLNFIYGKMMKKYTRFKQQLNQKDSAVEGGSK